MKIICWNVNGLRSVRKKNFDKIIDIYSPEIICIQETKAKMEKLKDEHRINGYKLFWTEGLKQGYSGVAIWVKENINVISFLPKIDVVEFDNEGRTILLELENFFIINSYFPNGKEDNSRVDFKLKYSYKILEIANKLKIHKPVIILGDFNTAHKEIDLYNPEDAKFRTGFLKNERFFLDSVISNGFIDAYRCLYPNKINYSWWSYQGNAKIKNLGWRIDYCFLYNLKPKKCEYLIQEDSSDHCPIVLEL